MTVERFFLWFTKVMAIVVILGYITTVFQSIRINDFTGVILMTIVFGCLAAPLIYFGFFNKK